MTAIFVGEAMVELTSVGDRTLAWTFAGDALNCAAAAAAAAPDIDVRFLTGVGDDRISAQLIEYCASLGVDASGSPALSGRNLGMYWIITEDGQRQFRYWRGESAARHALQQGLELPAPERGSAVVMSGITLAVAGAGADRLLAQLHSYRSAGALVGFDANYRAALWGSPGDARTAAETAAGYADVVIASADDIHELWSEEPHQFCARMAALGVAEVLVSAGPDAVLLRVGDSMHELEPPHVDAVDTTGAGDALFGTYLGKRLSGQGPLEAATTAIDVATRSVQHRGALNYLLDLDRPVPETQADL